MPSADPAPSPAHARPDPVALADQCVMCGLCLPHCPSYRVLRSEADSPRGRIALARGLAQGALPATADTLSHLDRCLACGTCERVCPSQVRYLDLLQITREGHPVAGGTTRWLWPWLTRPRRLRAAVGLARALAAARWLPHLAAWLLPRTAPLARAAAEFPPPPAPQRLPAFTPAAHAPARGRIGLLLGCVASAYDRDTLAAAIRLLAALGYDVLIPPDQGCCGALARHAGEASRAAAQAAPTRAALEAEGIDVVLVAASGCHDTVRDLTLAGSGLAVQELCSFLAADAGLDDLEFRPLARRAALHVACSQAGIAGSATAMHRLLARIPQLDVVALGPQPACCGAAGSYFLQHPDIAAPLRAEKLDQLAALDPDVLLTANIGCRLYLGNGLRQRGSTLEVRHPVALLAQQLAATAGAAPLQS